MRIRILPAFVLLLGLAALAIHLFVPPFLKSGTGITAKQMCSLTFVSGLPPQRAWELYLEPILDPYSVALRYDVDARNKEASASVLGFGWQSRAVYREGLGCTLVHGRRDGFDRDLAAPITGPAVPMLLSDEERAAKFNSDLLKKAVDGAFADPKAGTLAVVVLSGGELVAERYADGITPETPLHGWSMTKSAAVTMAGVLALSGDIDVTARGQVPPLKAEGRPDITLDDLFRMQAGLAIDEVNSGFDPNSDMLFTEADMPAFAASRKKVAEPGEVWDYQSGQTNLAGTAMRKALGNSPAEQIRTIRARLFEPLGIRTAILEPDQAGNFVWSSYMYASARDWARLGQLYVDGGLAPNGERLLPEDWPAYVATATGPSRGNYGAGFWLTSNSAETGSVVMDGFQGQTAYIFPSAGLVIVRLAAENGWSGTARTLAQEVVAARLPNE